MHKSDAPSVCGATAVGLSVCRAVGLAADGHDKSGGRGVGKGTEREVCACKIRMCKPPFEGANT